jgi:hypothetical protein
MFKTILRYEFTTTFASSATAKGFSRSRVRSSDVFKSKEQRWNGESQKAAVPVCPYQIPRDVAWNLGLTTMTRMFILGIEEFLYFAHNLTR